jgi:hypothetical protein
MTDSTSEGLSPDSSTGKNEKSQPTLELTPEYECYAGVAHEWTGTLFVPAPGESERLTKERKSDEMSVVGSKPVIFEIAVSRGNRFARSKDDFTKVKLDPMLALRLRAKGQ